MDHFHDLTSEMTREGTVVSAEPTFSQRVKAMVEDVKTLKATIADRPDLAKGFLASLTVLELVVFWLV